MRYTGILPIDSESVLRHVKYVISDKSEAVGDSPAKSSHADIVVIGCPLPVIAFLIFDAVIDIVL